MTTWRKTDDKEYRQDGWTSWAEAKGTAHKRAGWKAISYSLMHHMPWRELTIVSNTSNSKGAKVQH